MTLSEELYISPDDTILSQSITDDLIQIRLAGVYYAGDYHDDATLIFRLQFPARSMSYDSGKDLWITQDSIEPFNNICEFHRKMNSHFSINGFSQISGHWMSLGFTSIDAQIMMNKEAEQGVTPQSATRSEFDFPA